MIIPTPNQQKNNRQHSMPEGKIQASCFQFFYNNYPQYRGLYFAVPNENSRADSNAITGAIRKAMGVYHGVSDTIMMIPRGRFHGLCIEYKDKKGKQSVHQLAWQKIVEEQGYKYVVCRSLEEFQQIIDNYLNL